MVQCARKLAARRYRLTAAVAAVVAATLFPLAVTAAPITQALALPCENNGIATLREDACTKAIQLSGSEPRQSALLHVYRGYARLDLHKTEDAIADFTTALTVDSTLWAARVARAQLYTGTRRYAESLADWNEVVAMRPQLSAGYSGQGQVLERLGRTDDSLRAWNKAIELAGDKDITGDLLGGRSSTYEGARNYDLALADLDEAVRRDGKSEENYNERGRIHTLRGEYKAAIADLTKALELNAGNQYGSLWLFIAQARNGDDALGLLRLRGAGNNPSVWPGPIIQALLGQITPSQAKMDTVPGGWPAADQTAGATCELSFYLGEQALARGQRDKAAALFKDAVDTNIQEYVEYRAAAYELKQLGLK